jgi:hypothetical protein
MKETLTRAEMPSPGIPKGSVVFALGFLHLGEKNGKIDPGGANTQLADTLERHAGWFSLVLTQKAISDALDESGSLQDGTPVFPMHRHDPEVPVRTLAALMCALERLSVVPEHIVLLAHPQHIRRALMDLKALYSGEIMVLYPGRVVYPDKHWAYPVRWAIKNALAWPVDFLLMQSIKHQTLAPLWCILRKLGIRADCNAAVRLPRIVWANGKWKEAAAPLPNHRCFRGSPRGSSHERSSR